MRRPVDDERHDILTGIDEYHDERDATPDDGADLGPAEDEIVYQEYREMLVQQMRDADDYLYFDDSSEEDERDPPLEMLYDDRHPDDY